MLVSCCFVFFFFKQKTAYEMRVSDWSSDVCSSDLEEVLRYNPPVQIIFRHTTVDTEIAGVKIPAGSAVMPILASANRDESKFEDRSEEHTSELQSLMRISYAVFCLKNKKKA